MEVPGLSPDPATQLATSPRLRPGEAFAWAWETLKHRFPLFLSILLLMFASWVVLEVAVIGGHRLGIVWWTAWHLAFFWFFAAAELGLLRVCLALRDGRSASVRDAFAHLHDGARFFGAQLLFGLMVLAGLALLVVPGVYLAACFGFYGFAMADGEPGVLAPLRKSARLTGRVWLQFALVLVGLGLLNVLGACFLGIGLLVTGPLTLLTLAALYRQLS